MTRIALLGLAGLLFAACSSDDTEPGQSSGAGNTVTTGGSMGGSFNAPACGEVGETFPTVECSECAEANCCDQLSACDSNGTCTALIDCTAGCSDQTCADGCTTTHADGVADLDAVNACLGGGCAAECPMSSGICDTGLTLGSQACDTCLGDNCCSELNACLVDTNCAACIDGGGVDCDSDMLFATVGGCFMTSCDAQCSG